MNRIFLFILLVFLSGHPFAQTAWKSIKHRNGFHLQLPPSFKKGLLVAGGTLQYYEHTSDQSIVVTVETFGSGTRKKLQQEYNETLKRRTVTYSTLKPTWFVVSGNDEDGVFYWKTIISQGLMHHLLISYPKARQEAVDRFLGKMSASFR